MVTWTPSHLSLLRYGTSEWLHKCQLTSANEDCHYFFSPFVKHNPITIIMPRHQEQGSLKISIVNVIQERRKRKEELHLAYKIITWIDVCNNDMMGLMTRSTFSLCLIPTFPLDSALVIMVWSCVFLLLFVFITTGLVKNIDVRITIIQIPLPYFIALLLCLSHIFLVNTYHIYFIL